MIRFCAVLRPVWNRVCKQQNRRIILVAVAFLVALPWIISSCNETKTTKEAQSHITEAIGQVHQAETPVPTPDSPYKSEAEAVARVLYGIRNNKEQDLRTYAWCIFNRVDNPSSEFADTLEAVIGKPEQWMFYDPNNPVIDSLYQIALQEVTRWHEDERPVSYEYVYAEWSIDDVLLRDTWEYSDKTRTWRYPES